MVSSMDDSDEELDQLFGGPDSELEKVGIPWRAALTQTSDHEEAHTQLYFRVNSGPGPTCRFDLDIFFFLSVLICKMHSI